MKFRQWIRQIGVNVGVSLPTIHDQASKGRRLRYHSSMPLYGWKWQENSVHSCDWEKITRWYEDMNYIFEWWKQYLWTSSRSGYSTSKGCGAWCGVCKKPYTAIYRAAWFMWGFVHVIYSTIYMTVVLMWFDQPVCIPLSIVHIKLEHINSYLTSIWCVCTSYTELLLLGTCLHTMSSKSATHLIGCTQHSPAN